MDQASRHLAYWEIETFLEHSPSFLYNVYSQHLSTCPICSNSLHYVSNTFSNDYKILMMQNKLSYEELVDSFKNEIISRKIRKYNLTSPILLPKAKSKKSVAIRLNQSNNFISPAFLISMALEIFETNTFKRHFPQGKVFMVAGEINYQTYAGLKDYYLDLVMGKGLSHIDSIECVGGPNFSCPDEFDLEKGNLIDSNFFIKLYLENKYQDKIRLYRVKGKREPFHFIVHEYDDSICILEDYHNEFDEKSATVIFDNRPLCNMLRKIAQKTIAENSIKIRSKKNLKEYMMHKSDIKEQANQRDKDIKKQEQDLPLP